MLSSGTIAWDGEHNCAEVLLDKQFLKKMAKVAFLFVCPVALVGRILGVVPNDNWCGSHRGKRLDVLSCRSSLVNGMNSAMSNKLRPAGDAILWHYCFGTW